MFSTLISIALLASLALQSVVADIAVGTPEFVQCQTVELTWQKTTGPYDVAIVPPTDPCNTILADLGSNNTGTTLQWKVTLAAGTQAQVSVLDKDGDEGWSGNITVKASSDSSCLTSASSATPAATPATTLVVPASQSTSSVSGSAGPSDGGAQPVGAANAGLNPTSNSAFQHGAPSLALGLITALIVAFSL